MEKEFEKEPGQIESAPAEAVAEEHSEGAQGKGQFADRADAEV
jgi:hypothetical protein